MSVATYCCSFFQCLPFVLLYNQKHINHMIIKPATHKKYSKCGTSVYIRNPDIFSYVCVCFDWVALFNCVDLWSNESRRIRPEKEVLNVKGAALTLWPYIMFTAVKMFGFRSKCMQMWKYMKECVCHGSVFKLVRCRDCRSYMWCVIIVPYWTYGSNMCGRSKETLVLVSMVEVLFAVLLPGWRWKWKQHSGSWALL